MREEIELFCAVKLSNMSQYWKLAGCSGRVRQTYFDQSRNDYALPGRSLTYSAYVLSSKTQSAFRADFVVQDTAFHPMTIDVLASGTLHISALRNQAAELCSKGRAERCGGIHLIVFPQHERNPNNAEIPSAPQAASSVVIKATSYKSEGNVQVQSQIRFD